MVDGSSSHFFNKPTFQVTARGRPGPPLRTEVELWPQFYHGAFLAAGEQSSGRSSYGEILNVEATAVMFSCWAAMR